MEILAEFFLELYLEIILLLVPERKFKKWQEVLIKVITALITIAIIVILCVGISLITEQGQNVKTGIILTCISGTLLLVQAVLTVYVIAKEIKKEKSDSGAKKVH